MKCPSGFSTRYDSEMTWSKAESSRKCDARTSLPVLSRQRQRIAVEIHENVGGVRAIDHLGGDAL